MVSEKSSSKIYFLVAVLAPIFTTGCFAADSIDRFALVNRHNPVIHKADALSPFSLGNGNFCFTADITGLQTFPVFYEQGITLCTQSHWGFHTFANDKNYKLEDIMVDVDSYGRMVKYADVTKDNSQACEWLRSNPHRLGLARVGLKITKPDGSIIAIEDCQDVNQELNLWTGILTSRFNVQGNAVQVETSCHPDMDMIAVRVKSKLILSNNIGVTIDFPYGSDKWGKEPGDWNNPQLHKTTVISRTAERIDLKRRLDNDTYYVSMAFAAGGNFSEAGADKHHYEIVPAGTSDNFEFVIAFAPAPLKELPDVTVSQRTGRQHWKNFWQTGGAIDLSGSTDPRADELERRIVLSQYLMAIQNAGNYPPAETGLTFNSWYGKPHLEMHWWHAMHFALWGRPQLFEKSMPWYQSILPVAKKTAALQGYKGARWPKMANPDGSEMPSHIAAFIIWHQPHPIYYAELFYRINPDKKTLEKYKEMVFETAEFLASFAWWDKDQNRYVLGPPLIPAEELFQPRVTYNPTFELEYWRWALKTAQLWQERLGLQRNEKWDHVIEHLSKLPIKEGLYLAAESTPNTWLDKGQWMDHPSMLFAYGVVPGDTVDIPTMRRTLDMVMRNWNWPTTWGWDFPAVAITAARLGEPEKAIDALMMDTGKNTYLPNGHNYQHGDLALYLPGNGGLLTATAMMAAGWDGAPNRHAPGFPDNGKWKVRYEGLNKMP